MATLQEVVNTAYLQALGRPADPDGLKHYVAQLESGKRVDGRRIGIGDILADLNYAAATGVEDKAANQAITARGGWDFAPPPPPPAPSGGGGGGGSSVTPPNVVAPPSSNYGYINDLYKTYLGRDAGAEELASYAEILGPTIEPNEIRDFILGGVTSGEISSTRAADLLKTLPPPAAATEPLTAQGLYNQFLGGRPALEKDLQFWNDYIAQYGPEQAMAAFDAAAKQERDMDLAARAASLRDQELARDGTVMKDGEKTVREGALTAQGLYNEFLGGRSALPADIDYWNNYIAVYGPDKARAAFQESAKPEKEMPVEERVKSLRDQNLTVPGSLLSDFETQRKATPAEVRSMYLSVLGREPDPKGFSYYTSQPVENLRQSFYQASLPEMEKRVGAIDVTTTIPTPVIGQRSEPTAQELYLGLGRAPDPAGLAFYENYSQPNREADFATGAAEKGEQYDPTKPMTIGLPGQTTTTSLSGMTPQQRDLSRLVVSKMPQPVSETTTAPSVFSPENVAAQLELERLRLQPTPEPPPEEPVAGFAQGGLVSDDINRMLRNQQSAIQRESQSRRMLTNLGAPPVKKFSDGGPAGSSSGVRRLKMSGYQAGGDVTDEMFVGTTPSEESQQTTGEYIKGLYKENIPVHARVYLETLLGKKDPITAEDFTKEELADIEKLLSSKPAKGAVTEYSDYEKVRDLDREGRHSSDWLENLPSVGKTLGRFTYETLPDGRRVIKDTYDFYNTSRSINVQEFEEMGPAEKALAVFKRITADRSVMDPPFVKRAADVLGEAYIGRDGRPVKVEYDPKDLPVKRQDGSPSQGEISDDMFLGTRPEDFPETSPVDKKAGELLRALSEGTRGFVGAEPIEPGSEAYRTGQALANMPAVGVVAATAKGAGKAKDALKALTKKDIKLIASELETSRGQLAELAKKYPQLRDASVADIEALTKGEPFTAFRGISLLPGRELRKESTPSMTVDPSVALGMLKDAPVMITKEGFITATPVLRQYPGMKASETQVYVPSLIEQITERQPGALEMKIPTRSGEKMTVADVFKEVKGEKELLADVSKKEPRDILFDRYQGGVGDRYLMEVARRVLAGKWDGGEALLKEIGGYQTDPKGLVQEFDSFAELVKESALKKAKGGEVTNDEFIQEMMIGTRPTDETTSPGILPPEIRQAVDVPLDLANLAIRGTAAAVAGPAYGLYKGLTSEDFGTKKGVTEARSEAERMMGEITGEPKTQAAKDIMQFVGEKLEAAKIPPMPQFLTTPVPGPGAASALMRSYELAETPPSGVVKMPGGNWLKGQVEYFVSPLKKDIPWTQGQLEEMPGVAKAEAPNLALNKFIETGLTRYIKNDMASAKDTLRNLADENTIKAGKAYNNDLRQVKKAYDRAEKIKAEGPRPNMLPGTWENAIEAQLGRARQLEEEANRKLNLELRHALPFPVLQEDGELAGGLNFLMRRNLQTGGEETLVSSRKEAGQAEEGVAQTPTGKVWETMADLFVKPQAAGQITDQDYFMRSTDSQRVLRNNPWLATVPPETPVYIPQDVVRSSSFLNSFSADDFGFKHITDELANAMNPGSGLPANLLLTPDEVANMGMEKAARHVIEINKWREEQMGVANALRAQKSISLYKDYPTIPGKTEPNQRGLQWLELKLMPEDDTPESMVKAKEALADALKYEGEVMGHCVGGECPKVESGKSRIISLRDAKGEPHVTLEVIPPEVNFSDVLGGNPAFPNRDPELYRMMDTMTTTQIEKTPLYKEKAAAIAAQKLPGISQIKGKGNNRPPDSYQPFITDFIASQQWSSVGDLQNTNLVRIEPMILKNAQDRGFNPQIVTTIKERPYITKEEFNRLADLFGGMNKYAAGGEVTDFIKRAA
jgi:hypothetical protein